jgi:hypothetical protein
LKNDAKQHNNITIPVVISNNITVPFLVGSS